MQRVERSVSIDAPPADVFAYLSDLDRLAEWQSGVIGARRTSDGRMGVGATAQVTRQLMGQRLEAPLTVTAYDPPRRLTVGSEVSGIRADATLDVAADGAGSQVSFAMEFRGSMMTAFMEPMIASAAAGDIEASLARLRSRLEGDDPAA